MTRIKGSKNVKTEQWEMFTDWFMTIGVKRLGEEMEKLEGKDFVYTVKDLLEYFKPKLARTELTGKDGGEIEVIQVPKYDSQSSGKSQS